MHEPDTFSDIISNYDNIDLVLAGHSHNGYIRTPITHIPLYRRFGAKKYPGDYYKEGIFKPYTLEMSVELCADILDLFYNNNIDVIRLGLHYSDSLVQNCLFNNYHPAFRQLCESKIMLRNVNNQLSDKNNIRIYVNPSSVSRLIGQKKSNINALLSKGYSVNIEKDPSLGKYEVKVEET
jgi:hypothetical protein